MGVVFFLTLTPLLLAILGILIVMAVIGVAVFVVGVGGSIASVAALSDKKMKAASVCFFSSLLLLGISCLATIAGVFIGVFFFIAPLLIVVGLAVLTLGVVAIVKSFKIEKTAAKITLIVLLSLSTIIGVIVLLAGVFILFAS